MPRRRLDARQRWSESNPRPVRSDRAFFLILVWISGSLISQCQRQIVCGGFLVNLRNLSLVEICGDLIKAITDFIQVIQKNAHSCWRFSVQSLELLCAPEGLNAKEIDNHCCRLCPFAPPKRRVPAAANDRRSFNDDELFRLLSRTAVLALPEFHRGWNTGKF